MMVRDYLSMCKALLLSHQDPRGAFPASPDFPQYQYCWFRDGTFIAYSLDLLKEHDAAGRFHSWVVGVILRNKENIKAVIDAARAGAPVPADRLLHARYSVTGDPVPGEWGNHQLDGLGAWLWGVHEHIRARDGDLPVEWRRAIEFLVDYLCVMWRAPCYDCWEEAGDRVHTSTLAAVYGGLTAVRSWVSQDQLRTLDTERKSLRQFILSQGIVNGHFNKMTGSDDVDASLLWLAVPFRVVDVHDPIMQATVQRIEDTLVVEHGVHRYAGDVFYGGGQWILLAAWFGWYYAIIGKHEQAERFAQWIEGHFTEHGHLSEQVNRHLRAPQQYDPWVEKWGPPASLLLWSLAMYIILQVQLKR